MSDLDKIVTKLNRAVDGPGSALSALIELRGDRGAELLTVLQERYRAELAERINTAGGNAASHSWEIREHVDGDLSIKCGACRLESTAMPMRYGQVPMCGGVECPLSHHTVFSLDGPDVFTAAGSAYCIFCKTEFPATVEVAEVTA
jgi:hypothetical protein